MARPTEILGFSPREVSACAGGAVCPVRAAAGTVKIRVALCILFLQN